MQIEQFRAVLDAYGARPERWPEDRRRAMQACLAEHAEARRWLRDAEALDEALDALPAGTVDLTSRVLAALPVSRVDRVLAWLLPPAPDLWWRPTALATVPVLLGAVIGFSDGGATADWAAHEQALLGLGAGSGWDLALGESVE